MEIPKYSAVFLGDYVDRGHFSLECYIYLLLLKMTFPTKVFLLRGNHESLDMTSYFTFKAEVLFKHNLEIYTKIIESFKKLPLAAVVLRKGFCVHGGISPKLGHVSAINKVNRAVEPNENGLVCDLLWSDPSQSFTASSVPQFKYNSKRRCSFSYNYTAVKDFLDKNAFHTIFRGHEVQYDGYMSYKSYKDSIPSLYTIFSAPNYCDIYQNTGAIAFYNGQKVKMHFFEASLHPFTNTNFVDVINQTMPYVCEKITEFYLDLLEFLQKKESVISSDSNGSTTEEAIAQTTAFANKMILLRLDRENSCEFPIYTNTLSATTCRTGEDINLDHKVAAFLDSDNEVFKQELEGPESESIELSPSLAPQISKDIVEIGLEDVLKRFTIKSGIEDEFEVSIESDESFMIDNSGMFYE